MAVDDSYSKALLHFDGLDASTTFTDESGKTWTAVGNAQIDTDQSVFGGASGKFDGSGDLISTPDSLDFDFADGDFTIDFRMRWFSGEGAIISKRYSYSTNHSFGIEHDPYGDKLVFVYTVNGTTENKAQFSFAASANTWYHIAFARSGTGLYCFVNGSQVGSTYNMGTDDIYTSTQAVKIGCTTNSGSSTYYFNGWLDEFRISKGIARWTANFTPPAAAYGSAPPQTAARRFAQII